MSRKTIRILSDLHYSDDTSWLQSLPALSPLFEAADRVIVNGDALDSQVTADGPEKMAELKAFFASQVSETTFVTGNHDPDISDVHELSLAEGRVWLSHGDVLYPDMVPWSRALPEIHRRLAKATADISPAMRNQIQTRLRVHRQISVKLPPDHNPLVRGPLSRIHRILRVLLPPQRALALLRHWREMPQLAEHLAHAQRPKARFVLMGHTHFQGAWRQPSGRVIINTGSFCPPRGGQFVEIVGDRLRVRRIVRRAGSFHCGPTVAEFPLAGDPVSALVR